MHLGNNIKELMSSHRLSRKDLADALDVNVAQIGKYISESSYPRFEGLLALAKLFNVNLHDLIMLDLSEEEPRAFDEKDNDASDERVEELNQLLRQRVRVLEREILRKDPDLARELGIE